MSLKTSETSLILTKLRWQNARHTLLSWGVFHWHRKAFFNRNIIVGCIRGIIVFVCTSFCQWEIVPIEAAWLQLICRSQQPFDLMTFSARSLRPLTDGLMQCSYTLTHYLITSTCLVSTATSLSCWSCSVSEQETRLAKRKPVLFTGCLADKFYRQIPNATKTRNPNSHIDLYIPTPAVCLIIAWLWPLTFWPQWMLSDCRALHVYWIWCW